MAIRDDIIAAIAGTLDTIDDVSQEVAGQHVADRFVLRIAGLETTYPDHLTNPTQAGQYQAGAQKQLGSAIAEIFENSTWRTAYLGAIADGILVAVAGGSIDEIIDDRVASLLVAGTGITLSYNDAGNLLTISSSAAPGSGTIGKIAKWATTTTLTDSLITESASLISIGGALTTTGVNTFSDLAGSGSRVVVASSTGALSAASTLLTGSGTAGKITKWATSSTFTDSLITESTGLISIAGALTTSGANTLSDLAGSGSRVVVASATGLLSATSALLTGSGTAGRVAYWSGSSTLTSVVDFLFTDGGSGTASTLTVANASNTANSHAIQLMDVGGASAGDPKSQYSIGGTVFWSAGVDTSTTNRDYVISRGSALGNNNRFSMDINGALVIGNQATPASGSFVADYAYNSNAIVNFRFKNSGNGGTGEDAIVWADSDLGSVAFALKNSTTSMWTMQTGGAALNVRWRSSTTGGLSSGLTVLAITTAGAVSIAGALSVGGAFIGSSSLSVATTSVLTGAVTMGSTASVAGIATLSSRVNVNGAADNSGYALNVSSSSICATGTGTIASYGVALPGNTNKEYGYIQHDGSNFRFVSEKAGTGTYRPITLEAGGSVQVTISAAGVITATNLAGSGTRAVVASATGALSAASALVTGSGTAGQVAYWSGTSAMTSDSSFTYSGGTVSAGSFFSSANSSFGGTTIALLDMNIGQNFLFDNSAFDGQNSFVLFPTLTKNNANTRQFYVAKIRPTLNAGGSNTTTTVNLLEIDTVNTSVTGLTVNLSRWSYGGSQRMLLDSAGRLNHLGGGYSSYWGLGDPDATDKEVANLFWGGSQFQIQTAKAGSGSYRDIVLHAGLGALLTLEAANGNFGFNGVSFGGGSGVLALADSSTSPTSNPSGGVIIFSDSGAAKVRGASGTVTTFGPADPHCPECGADFMHEFESERYGYLAVCLKCAADEIGERKWILRKKEAAHSH